MSVLVEIWSVLRGGQRAGQSEIISDENKKTNDQKQGGNEKWQQ